MTDHTTTLSRAHGGSEFETLASYSTAARVRRIVAVSGTPALDDNDVALCPGDSAAQTRLAIERALEAAAQLGARREDVIRTRVFLKAGGDWLGPAKARGELFRGVDPANTTRFVADLIPEECLVEVELDAVLPDDRGSVR